MAAAEEMVEQNMKLVYHWVEKYRQWPAYRNLDADDLIQEGCLGLMRACERFDGTRGCEFSTYASYWIRQRIRRYRARVAKWPPAFVGVDGMAFCDDTTWLAVIESEKRGFVASALGALDNRTRDIIAAHFGIGRPPETLETIAARVGVSRERVRQIRGTGLRRLRRLCGAIGDGGE